MEVFSLDEDVARQPADPRQFGRENQHSADSGDHKPCDDENFPQTKEGVHVNLRNLVLWARIFNFSFRTETIAGRSVAAMHLPVVEKMIGSGGGLVKAIGRGLWGCCGTVRAMLLV